MGEEAAAIEAATAAINTFAGIHQSEWLRLFRAKIGIVAPDAGDAALIEGLLTLMAGQKADFTRTFRGLIDGTARDEFTDRDAFDAWAQGWRTRIAREADPAGTMRAANPARIPRNHRIEEAIAAAVAGDPAPFHRLNAALARPFEHDPAFADFERAPLEDEEVRRTFCGT
jgi:uncharacterized protein YdiU (UPF0061 family)